LVISIKAYMLGSMPDCSVRGPTGVINRWWWWWYSKLHWNLF